MTRRASSDTSPKNHPTTIGFVNLGCSKNQVDAEVMLGALVQDSFALTPDPSQAEVIIINTCGFIEEAKQESINAIIEYGGADYRLLPPNGGVDDLMALWKVAGEQKSKLPSFVASNQAVV